MENVNSLKNQQIMIVLNATSLPSTLDPGDLVEAVYGMIVDESEKAIKINFYSPRKNEYTKYYIWMPKKALKETAEGVFELMSWYQPNYFVKTAFKHCKTTEPITFSTVITETQNK